MSAETQLYATLSADAAVVATVGTRIYPDFLAEEMELPGIVTQRADTEYTNTIHTGLPVAERVTMDTWCLANTRIAAEALADKVNTALPAGQFRIIGRRPEFDPDTLIYATVVTSEIWL